jgi:hypothetical protein
MFIDGVMRGDNGSPIRQGIDLYRTLREKNQVLILCPNKARDERWLKENKINAVDDLISSDVHSATEWVEWKQVEYCRGKGSVEIVVTADPKLAEKLLSVGITSFMFLNPIYISERFRPDSQEGRKSWQDIKDEIIRQQDMYLNDHRIN